MDVKQIYRENTNNEVYSENANGDYSDRYVHWLESKLIHQLTLSNNTLVDCKYVRKIRESCTLNDNCKYPNCDK